MPLVELLLSAEVVAVGESTVPMVVKVFLLEEAVEGDLLMRMMKVGWLVIEMGE